MFVMEAPLYERPLLISDAAINIYPTLEDKVDIVQNAIDLAHTLGNPMPKVAILSAIETVNPKIISTLDAAALCKMAERGQITGAILDGPLAFDTAVSEEAARVKHLQSAVVGKADILIVPDLESGNMLAKQLEYLGGARLAGIVVGASVPIILTSRADSAESRVASSAVGSTLAHARRLGTRVWVATREIPSVIKATVKNPFQTSVESKRFHGVCIGFRCRCCPWANIDSTGLTTSPFQLAPLLFRVSHCQNLRLDPNEQIHSGFMKLMEPTAAVPAHLGQVLQLE